MVGMFGFCYLLVPFYNVFCKALGVNGKTDGTPQMRVTKVDKSRTITVELLATQNESLPGGKGLFRAKDKKFTFHPGEYVSTAYFVENKTPAAMVVQAIPSVTPGHVARHIKKVECFCFTKQPLEPNEGKEMPLVFTVDPALPTSVKTLTLAYTLFDVTER